MKLKIKVSIVYPDNPPTGDRTYPTRNEEDSYEQQMEIHQEELAARLELIIKAFNNFQ